MIPLCLRVSGFLSYRDPVELDFTSFDLACISGPNGAGKSTLLDAMTWALFGQARKRDESLINLQSKAAEVVLTFRYEGAVYRVQRSLVRGKTPTLEFQVQQPPLAPELHPLASSGRMKPDPSEGPDSVWRPLTERTLHDTQARIESILRLDYDTFVNASFFLQGKADQFAQQTPARRKEVLSSILGLGSWEEYRARTADQRRLLETEIAAIEGRRSEIAAELAEETPRRQRLEALQAELTRLSVARKSQESALETIRKAAAAMDGQRKTVEALNSALESLRSQLSSLSNRLAEREAVRRTAADVTGRADEIHASYAAWQQARASLEQWETVATAFREHEQLRRPLLEAIAVERARLEEEIRSLKAEELELDEQAASIRNLEPELDGLRRSLAESEARLAERSRLQAELATARESQASARAENETLRAEMDTLHGRIDALESAAGATCPLCGQPLSASHRRATLKSLKAEGTRRGDRFRANKASLDDLAATISRLEAQLAESSGVEAERLARSAAVAQLSERLETLHSLARSWKSTGLKRLTAIQDVLARDKYASEARRELAKVDKQLARLGYDAAAHDAARGLELDLRRADEEHRGLESALAALAPLEDEIRNLRSEIANRDREVTSQEGAVQRAESALEAAIRAAPDLDEAEQAMFAIQEQENALNRELGAARQKVQVLDDLRLRDAEFESTRQSLALQIGRHKVLERAFGKDGVPALLIEQALPEIETRANEVLDRLSDGRMSVHFLTQTGYKDRKREDLRETLEIQISDGAGIRDYELYSGGEAFRINFAVRLALSEVLAARKGARLQTLVIDEGFGSQDDQGRQRLIEAINLVKDDFALVLVITHLEQLKDAFPTRIEIEKTDAGSTARIL
jgi:exonuclease SbcC